MDGKSYGVDEEGTLLDLLQALANMWSFYGCRFLKGNTSSSWYELGARIVNKKVLHAHLLLPLGQTKIVMAQDVEWIWCFKNFPSSSF